MEGIAERRYHPWRERLWSLVVGSKVLEVGKILMPALTPEELEQLRKIMSSQALDHLLVMSLSSRSDVGNTSVT